jgi:hypothetical protein
VAPFCLQTSVTIALTLFNTLCSSLQHVRRFSVCCIFTGYHLVTAFNAVASSASVFMSILPGDCLTTHSLLQLINSSLTVISHLTPTLLTAVSRPRNRSFSSLYSLGTGRIENTSPNSSSIVASHKSHGPLRVHRFPYTPLLPVTNLLRPLPSNGHCSQSHYLATAVV